MCVYVDKLCMMVGWCGYLFDFDMDGSNDMGKGVCCICELMVVVSEFGLLVVIELFDFFVLQYFFDVVVWVCLGVCIVELQIYWVMVSVVSVLMGFKNGIGGGIKFVVDVVVVVSYLYVFFIIDEDGCVVIVYIKGNVYGYVILCGGCVGFNYVLQFVQEVVDLLCVVGCEEVVMVDCLYVNLGLDWIWQCLVWCDVLGQCFVGQCVIWGVMLESNL